MENNLKESFLKTKDPIEEKYLPFIELEFDYEINRAIHCTSLKEEKYSLSNKSQNCDKLSETFSEKDTLIDYDEVLNNLKNENNDKFSDELAPRYFRCEQVAFFKKNYFKALISNKRIRLINQNFDLDLVYEAFAIFCLFYPSI